METKVWYKSRAIWAGILTLVFGVYSLIRPIFADILPDISNYLPAIILILGSIGIYGRVDASGKIVFSDVKGN